MATKRKSTSAKIVEETEEDGVLDFGKFEKLLPRRRSNGRFGIDPEDGFESSKTNSVDSSSARQRAVALTRPEEYKRLPPRACRITSWTTAGPNRHSEPKEQRSPRKSPKKTKSVEKGTSPLKVDIPSNKNEVVDLPKYDGPPIFLVKRPPIKRPQDLSNKTVDEATHIRRRRRTRRERSPIFPPPSTKHYQPLAVLQKLPEPHSQLEELTTLLGSAISEIRSLQNSLKEREEADTIESVLARGLLATNNKPIFKKVLRWTMKNCRTEMVKKIEKKLGLKLKRKTRAQLENELPEELPTLQKPSQIKKPFFKKAETEDVNEALFPNLMVNRVLLGLTRNDSIDNQEEKND